MWYHAWNHEDIVYAVPSLCPLSSVSLTNEWDNIQEDDMHLQAIKEKRNTIQLTSDTVTVL